MYKAKILKRQVICILFSFVAIIAKAQAASNPGWLQEISGNGLEQKSFLFGTCHGDGLIAMLRREGYTVEHVKSCRLCRKTLL